MSPFWPLSPFLPLSAFAPLSPFCPLSPLFPDVTKLTKIFSESEKGLSSLFAIKSIVNVQKPVFELVSVIEYVINCDASYLLVKRRNPFIVDVTALSVVNIELISLPSSSVKSIYISVALFCDTSLFNLSLPVPGSASVVLISNV